MTVRSWPLFPAAYDEGIGAALSIGVIGLAEDRAGVWDLDRFLRDIPGIGVFSTRVPMSADVTPQSLAQMGEHLGFCARTLLPGSPLDVIAFSCTSGTVAIGLDKVHAIISAVRPGVAISTPIEAGLAALHKLGTTKIALLTPYRPATSDLVAGFFEESGLSIRAKTTLNLVGDLDMNRVSADCLAAAARSCLAQAPGSEALFISCTGLRTSSVIQRLEDEVRLPVVTSNQALAWHCLRIAGNTHKVAGHGRLFAVH
ncbi:MAG TPA: Asp/Glu racemase [Nordella sp.]|nr:Asp/Glu racemase [Nordella sp.]